MNGGEDVLGSGCDGDGMGMWGGEEGREMLREVDGMRSGSDVFINLWIIRRWIWDGGFGLVCFLHVLKRWGRMHKEVNERCE